MFSDTYKLKLVDGDLDEVYGKVQEVVTRKAGDFAGFNPSAKEADEGTNEAMESGVQETFAFTDKKSYTLYFKDYMKKLVVKLEEQAPDQVDVFKTNTNIVMREILMRFKDLQFFTGESMNVDGTVGLMEYREIDGDSVPVLMLFKHGLEEEKF